MPMDERCCDRCGRCDGIEVNMGSFRWNRINVRGSSQLDRRVNERKDPRECTGLPSKKRKTKTSSVNKPQQQEQVKERVNSGCVPMPACVDDEA